MDIFGGPKQLLEDVRKSLLTSEIKALLFFAAILITVGTGFYMWIEDWSFVESFYFCVATLTTVGYGDLYPTGDVSRIFTSFFVLAGVGFMLTFVTVLARRASQSLARRVKSRTTKASASRQSRRLRKSK